MMGSTKDPADGKAVAGSVFAAVVVYAVCLKYYSVGGLEWMFGLGWNGVDRWMRSMLIGSV